MAVGLQRTPFVRASRGAALAGVFVLIGAASARADSGIGPLFHGGAAPVRVGPTPRGTGGTDAAACASCHAAIAAEWRESLHRQGWTDEIFQTAYDIEPLAF